MRRLTVLVDMDDTIENLLFAWVTWLNRIYQRDVQCDDIKSWDICAAYPGLSYEEVYGLLRLEAFWETVEPLPGAAEGLRSFLEAGHEVYIVTATTPEAVLPKMEKVLFRYFPFLTWRNVVITENKQLLRGDVLIDDGIHNLEGGAYEKILVTAPYNESYAAEKNGMLRVHNWDEIRAAVEALANNGGNDAAR